ncbi:MAG: hypothetical protein KC492_41185, partial [Myxococcales bacterium]|nr:hypothetical protein [Myxococcales bacterium]
MQLLTSIGTLAAMHRLGWIGLLAGIALFGGACSGEDNADPTGTAGTAGAPSGGAAQGGAAQGGAAQGGAAQGGAAQGGASNASGASNAGGAATAGGSGGMSGSGGSAAGSSATGGSGGAVAGTASLAGQIGRTARIPSGLDGVGNVYIAVFSDNPVTNMNAEALANTLIMDADLSQDGTGVSYRVDNIPLSNEPRYVVAFMDDDGNVTPDDPSPKKPDLIAFDGLSPITVTLAAPGVTELDLVLNAEIP